MHKVPVSSTYLVIAPVDILPRKIVYLFMYTYIRTSLRNTFQDPSSRGRTMTLTTQAYPCVCIYIYRRTYT